jgi:hypothetical protein
VRDDLVARHRPAEIGIGGTPSQMPWAHDPRVAEMSDCCETKRTVQAPNGIHTFTITRGRRDL